MIQIADPEARRGIRAVTQSLMQFAVLVFLWQLADRMSDDPVALRMIALSALGLLGLSELGYVMENGLRNLRVTASREGLTADAGGEDARP